MNTLIAKMGYSQDHPLFINTLVQCIKKREELEYDPYQPHKLKITILKHPKQFINKL